MINVEFYCGHHSQGVMWCKSMYICPPFKTLSSGLLELVSSGNEWNAKPGDQVGKHLNSETQPIFAREREGEVMVIMGEAR